MADESWHWVHRGETWPKAATTMKRSQQSSRDLKAGENYMGFVNMEVARTRGDKIPDKWEAEL